MAKILIHTLGSSGDLNPFLALGLELKRRGHAVEFALSPKFADKARALGFAATVAGEDPDWDSDLMRRMLAMHRTEPIKILFAEGMIPAIGPAAAALEPLVRDADLFLSHTIQLAAPAVAQRTGTPWVSASAATLIYETGAYPPPGVAWKGCPAALSHLGWRIGRGLFGDLDALAAAEYANLGVSPASQHHLRRRVFPALDPGTVVAVVFSPARPTGRAGFRSAATPAGMEEPTPVRSSPALPEREGKELRI